MEELLKSLPPALQYVIMGGVGVGIGLKLLQNVIKGWNEKAEASHADVQKGNIVAVSTATLADMRPMEEASRRLGAAADTLAGLSGHLEDLVPIVPMIKDIGEDVARLLALIEKQGHEAEIDRAVRKDRENREGHMHPYRPPSRGIAET